MYRPKKLGLAMMLLGALTSLSPSLPHRVDAGESVKNVHVDNMPIGGGDLAELKRYAATIKGTNPVVYYNIIPGMGKVVLQSIPPDSLEVRVYPEESEPFRLPIEDAFGSEQYYAFLRGAVESLQEIGAIKPSLFFYQN